MSETLIRGADTILTMDDDRRELKGADLLLRDGEVAGIGSGLQTRRSAEACRESTPRTCS